MWHNRLERYNLSDCYNGGDQFLREMMRIAFLFETWACLHIDFDNLEDVWPFYLEDNFGEACLQVMSLSVLHEFNESDCLRVAMKLKLPVQIDNNLPVPVDVKCSNPVLDSPFKQFRIQTERDEVGGNGSAIFTSADDPFDEDFGWPYFGLYGITQDEKAELITHRKTYGETVNLLRKLAPGISILHSRDL